VNGSVRSCVGDSLSLRAVAVAHQWGRPDSHCASSPPFLPLPVIRTHVSLTSDPTCVSSAWARRIHWHSGARAESTSPATAVSFCRSVGWTGEQSRAEQSRAEQSRAEQGRAGARHRQRAAHRGGLVRQRAVATASTALAPRLSWQGAGLGWTATGKSLRTEERHEGGAQQWTGGRQYACIDEATWLCTGWAAVGCPTQSIRARTGSLCSRQPTRSINTKQQSLRGRSLQTDRDIRSHSLCPSRLGYSSSPLVAALVFHLPHASFSE
jgi:hypothetical protein